MSLKLAQFNPPCCGIESINLTLALGRVKAHDDDCILLVTPFTCTYIFNVQLWKRLRWWMPTGPPRPSVYSWRAEGCGQLAGWLPTVDEWERERVKEVGKLDGGRWLSLNYWFPSNNTELSRAIRQLIRRIYPPMQSRSPSALPSRLYPRPAEEKVGARVFVLATDQYCYY